VHINRTIGTFPKLIHVPTHFFKIILAYNKNNNELKITEKFSILNVFDSQKSSDILPPGGGSFIGAFLVPNNDNVDTKAPLTDFVVRLDQLEALVGCRFFEQLLSPQERLYLDNSVPPERDMATVLSYSTSQATQQIVQNTPLLLSAR
jgi:DNA/RNA endonuclease G (NUC1)